ncbi:MAG TPA: cell division protein ZapA [Saprospiraceae bacterium]|nr:cell division protein ZapA [Saprospiraceae bacterium]
MAEESLINFKAIIGGDEFPMRIKETEVESVKQMVAEVNKKLNHFQINYKDRKKTDWLSMTLLTYAFENYKLEQGRLSDESQQYLDALEEKLSALVS